MFKFLALQKSLKGTSKQTERVNMHKVRLSVEEFHDTGHDWQSELLVSGSLPAKLPTQNVKFVNGIFSDSITNSKVRHLEFKTKSQCVLCYCSDMQSILSTEFKFSRLTFAQPSKNQNTPKVLTSAVKSWSSWRRRRGPQLGSGCL